MNGYDEDEPLETESLIGPADGGGNGSSRSNFERTDCHSLGGIGVCGRIAALLGASVAAVSSCYQPQVGRAELLRGAVLRLYYSRLTAYLYLGTLLLAACLLAITLGMDTPLKDAPGSLLFLECLVSLSMLMEVLLRAIALGSEYFHSGTNILDTFVAAASVFLMFWAAPHASKAHDYEVQKEDVELSQSLVMARIMFQFIRVMLIANHARRSRQAKSSPDDLDFDIDFGILHEQHLQQQRRLGMMDIEGL